MSYILQALKRAQVDLNERAVARGAVRSSRARARRPLWPWLVGGGLAISALVIGTLFVTTHRPGLAVVAPPPAAVENAETPVAAEAPKSEAPAPPALTESSRTEPAPRGEAHAAPASSEPTATVPAESKPSPTNLAPVHAQQGSHRSRPAETRNGEVQAMQAPAAAAPAPRPDTALALVQPPPPVRPASPPQARPSAPEPAIGPRQPAAPDLPADPPARRRRRARRGEPTSAPEPATTLPTPGSGAEAALKIEVLVWAADPKQRMVYMNGLKYVEGQKLESGAILEQIVEDGIVLVHNGQRIRVKAAPR